MFTTAMQRFQVLLMNEVVAGVAFGDPDYFMAPLVSNLRNILLMPIVRLVRRSMTILRFASQMADVLHRHEV